MRVTSLVVVSLGVVASVASSSSGSSFDEASPGADTLSEPDDFEETEDGRFASFGEIGVDPVTQNSYVVQGVRATADGPDTTSKRLFVVPPHADLWTASQNVSDCADLRMLFPGGDVVVMCESNGADSLVFLDPNTLAFTDVIETDARYAGTRLAPSQRFLAVANNAVSPPPLHVVDLMTQQIEILDEGGVFEATWLHQRDALVTVAFDEAGATVRLRDAAALSVVARTITIANAHAQFLFDFSFIGVSRDDALVALPVFLDDKNQIALIDVATGVVDFIEDAAGPVAFTPDDATIVAYRSSGGCDDTCGRLVLIDREDHTTAELDVPDVAMPEYFVSRTGNVVVVVETLGGAVVLADLDAGTTAPLAGTPAAGLVLDSFIVRDDAGELWLADDGLFVIDMLEGTLAEVFEGGDPDHLNRLPDGDLVLDNGRATGLVFFDPDTREVTARASIALPPP